MSFLDEILLRHEDKTLEYKRDLSSKSVLKTLVAFANTAGGMLIIGVEDNGKILGITDPLAIEEKLTSLIADNIEPFLLPTIKIVSHKKKSLVLVEVPFLGLHHHLKIFQIRPVIWEIGEKLLQLSYRIWLRARYFQVILLYPTK